MTLDFAFSQWCYYQAIGDAVMASYWYSEYVCLAGGAV